MAKRTNPKTKLMINIETGKKADGTSILKARTISGVNPNLTDDGEVLTIGATKTVSSETPEGTDLRAVLENYISVGIVKSSVL